MQKNGSQSGGGSGTAIGPEKNGGPKLYCVSGHVARPGVYEASMKTTVRELVEGFAGGVPGGRRLKAVIPGGSSVPILLPHQLDVEASFDGGTPEPAGAAPAARSPQPRSPSTA